MAVSERKRNDEGPWPMQAQVPTFGETLWAVLRIGAGHVGKLEPSGMRQTERLLHEAQGKEASKRQFWEAAGREWIAGHHSHGPFLCCY
jgi:hypothetical protein